MRRKQSYSYRKDVYCFSVNKITMFRETKEAAITAYRQYERLGKKVEWMGIWNGKKFEEDTITAASQ